MIADEVSAFALQLPESVEDEPFGPGALVYKVGGRVFAILQPASAERPAQVTLKCEPDLALHLRDQYPAISPGYHVNKRHWNTVILDSTVPDEELREMVEHSYDRVVAGLPRAERDRFSSLRADASAESSSPASD
jgi:predicted DNA-binding protein (MmcQ/YjbR family)